MDCRGKSEGNGFKILNMGCLASEIGNMSISIRFGITLSLILTPTCKEGFYNLGDETMFLTSIVSFLHCT